MKEKQRGLMAIAYELETMSNVLKTNLSRNYINGVGVQSQDVGRVTELHNKAVRLQELAEGL